MNLIKTSDIYLAATLIILGHNLIRTEPVDSKPGNRSIFTFVFEKVVKEKVIEIREGVTTTIHQTTQIIDWYESGRTEVYVHPKDLRSTLMRLKERIKEEHGDN